jgi:hypothetical protein
MESKIEIELKEIWEIKEELYNDFISSDFANYYDFVKNELKDLKYQFHTLKPKEAKLIDTQFQVV